MLGFLIMINGLEHLTVITRSFGGAKIVNNAGRKIIKVQKLAQYH